MESVIHEAADLGEILDCWVQGMGSKIPNLGVLKLSFIAGIGFLMKSGCRTV